MSLKQGIISPTTKDFYTKHKISQNEGSLEANMQNEKQSTISKLHEKKKKLKVSEKGLINRQKAHSEGKSLPKPNNIN